MIAFTQNKYLPVQLANAGDTEANLENSGAAVHEPTFQRVIEHTEQEVSGWRSHETCTMCVPEGSAHCGSDHKNTLAL